MFSRLIIIITAVTFLSCSSTKWMEGNWEGKGTQVDGKEWTVELSISENQISINYPSLSCNGTWQFLEKKNGASIYREKIEEGILNCDQGVEIQTKKGKDGTLLIEYYIRSYDANKPIAFALMFKR